MEWTGVLFRQPLTLQCITIAMQLFFCLFFTVHLTINAFVVTLRPLHEVPYGFQSEAVQGYNFHTIFLTGDKHKVTTCLENPEMSGNLTALEKMTTCQGIVSVYC